MGQVQSRCHITVSSTFSFEFIVCYSGLVYFEFEKEIKE